MLKHILAVFFFFFFFFELERKSDEMQKKIRFSLKISLVNVPKSAVPCGFVIFTEEILIIKLHLLRIVRIGNKISETNCSFRVKQHTTGKVLLLFFRTFMLVLTGFSFWRGEWALGIILWVFFLIFPDFLRSYLLSRLATRETTGIQHVYK